MRYTLALACLLFSLVAVDVSRGEIANFTLQLYYESFSTLLHTSVAGEKEIFFASHPFAVQIDSDAGTGKVIDATFSGIGPTGGTVERTFITQTGNFPDIITTTTKLTETLTLDPFTVAPEFESAVTGNIVPICCSVFSFASRMTVSFPDSFTVSGTYTVQGPTQTFSTPFNVLYERIESAHSTPLVQIGIRPGQNYPNDTTLWGYSGNPSKQYRPSIRDISGVVDGRNVAITFYGTEIKAGLGILAPEPASWLLACLALCCATIHWRKLWTHGK
jgi:hypothetical protein